MPSAARRCTVACAELVRRGSGSRRGSARSSPDSRFSIVVLPLPFGPDQAVDLAGPQAQRDVVERGQAAEALGHAGGDELVGSDVAARAWRRACRPQPLARPPSWRRRHRGGPLRFIAAPQRARQPRQVGRHRHAVDPARPQALGDHLEHAADAFGHQQDHRQQQQAIEEVAELGQRRHQLRQRGQDHRADQRSDDAAAAADDDADEEEQAELEHEGVGRDVALQRGEHRAGDAGGDAAEDEDLQLRAEHRHADRLRGDRAVADRDQAAPPHLARHVPGEPGDQAARASTR